MTPSSEALSKGIAQALCDKKAEDVLCMDMRHLDTAVCDFFVLGTATSRPHMESLLAHVEERMRLQLGEKPYLRSHPGASAGAEWVVLDYMDVMLHLFTEQKRSFYQLETLWGDALTHRYPSPVGV